jgi:hypothetical protein
VAFGNFFRFRANYLFTAIRLAFGISERLWIMLQHAVMSRSRGPRSPRPRNAAQILRQLPGQLPGRSNRRQFDRLPFPAEAVLVWNHELDASHAQRYRIIDAGDGGYRVHCDTALTLDMTGMILRILPDRGRSLDQAVQVAWTRPSVTGTGFEAGLRRL